MALNKGEYRVGISFNPSGDSAVDFIKAKAASLIMDIDGIHNPGDSVQVGIDVASAHNGEVARLKALAMTAVEEAAMWAVKAITKKPNV